MPQARPEWVIGKIFDLFVELGASEESAFFPIVYASGKEGLAWLEPDIKAMKDIAPLFDAIIKHIPAPTGDEANPLQMLVTTIGYDNFKCTLANVKICNRV